MGAGLGCLSCRNRRGSAADAVVLNKGGGKHKSNAGKSSGLGSIDGIRSAKKGYQNNTNGNYNDDDDDDNTSYHLTIDTIGESGAVRYEDEDGCDLFFEAHESLSTALNVLPYPPTSTGKSGQSRNVTVDHPQSLLDHTFKSPAGFDGDPVEKEGIEGSLISRSSRVLTSRLTERSVFGAGYPGELSPDELQACLEFRQRLKDHPDPTYRAMVYLYVDVDMNDDDNHESSSVRYKGPEEEAFALCRFLRARQFDVDKTFAMMDEHLDLFGDTLRANDLHRSKAKIEDQMNCPLPVFYTQLPMVDHGLAMNGAFVVYMKAGQIRLTDGFDCLNRTDTPKSFVDRYMPMVWYMACRVFAEVMDRNQTEQRQAAGSDGADFVVLAEAVVVVDLEGLPRELINKRTMELLPKLFRAIQCFPEILNRVLIINVPYFFPFVWSVLKHFVDARTAQKIGFYSSLASAQKDLLELIDPSQILSDYGGNAGNPTYNEALVRKLDRDGDYDRYLFERYSSKTVTKRRSGSDPTVHTLQNFSLTETETAELTVYTQVKLDTGAARKGKIGTKFFLLPDTNETPPIQTRTNGSRRRHPSPRYGQPAAISEEHSVVSGPGKFRLVVETRDVKPVIDRAFLVVSIR